jgi:hypothetical protein
LSAEDRWFRLVPVTVPNEMPPIYSTGDEVATVGVFQPRPIDARYPQQMIQDALRAIDTANPPLSPNKQSLARYAVPALAQAIARHRGRQPSELEGKAMLDHLTAAGMVQVGEVEIARSGRGPDKRQGLTLTTAGKKALAESPQSPIPST